MKRRRKALIAGIFFILLGLGLGYAFLTTNLNINGIADVDSNTWDIYWDNVQVSEQSVETEGSPYIEDHTTVSFYAPLSKPGDVYEFTVDAMNDGSIDAMVDIITKTINDGTTIPNYLNYTVTYDDDENTPIAEKQLLKSNSKETIKIRVEYRSDIASGDLPSTAQSFNLTFGISYVQADSTAQETRNFLYQLSTEMTIGEPIPTGAVYYSKYQDLVDDTTIGMEGGESYYRHAFFKHTIDEGVITESYLAFILNNQFYLLRGGVDEDCSDSHPIYESNKATLLAAFGAEHCNIVSEGNINCTLGNSYSSCYSNGDVYFRYVHEGISDKTYIYQNGTIAFQ